MGNAQKLDTDAVARALGERGSTGPCPYCGSSQWAVVEETMHVPQWMGSPSTEGAPVAAIVCKRCGNLRLHALSVLKP